MPTLEHTPNGSLLWDYIPSLAASIIFTILFAVVTGVNIWRMVRSRAWFCVPFCIGGIFEVVGYIFRAVCYNNTGSLGLYIIQTVFILLGPILLAATVYMLLGRVTIRTEGEAHSLISARWMTKIFVTMDVVAFLVQGGGAGLLVQASSRTTGKAIVIVGLLVQVIGFALFIICGGLFYRRMAAAPTRASMEFSRWVTIVRVLLLVSLLIMIRSIFRVAEYAGGPEGYLLAHEWPLYVFDAVLMFGVMVIFAYWHPGRIDKFVRHAAGEEMHAKSLDSSRSRELDFEA